MSLTTYHGHEQYPRAKEIRIDQVIEKRFELGANYVSTWDLRNIHRMLHWVIFEHSPLLLVQWV